jgi:hypothetical protein
LPWLAATLWLGLPGAACGGEPAKAPAPPAPGDVLLRIDGLEITFGEIEPYVKFLDEAMPEAGRKTKVQKVLQDFTVPLRLAQREFAEPRRKMHERATNLRAVSTNVLELEQQGAQQVIKRMEVTRNQVDLPIAVYLFDPLNTGGVSDVIEVPRGFVVAAAHEVKEAAAAVFDTVDAVQVGFFTHTPADWETWKSSAQERVADKATYIHPDFREAMPTWLKLP